MERLVQESHDNSDRGFEAPRGSRFRGKNNFFYISIIRGAVGQKCDVKGRVFRIRQRYLAI